MSLDGDDTGDTSKYQLPPPPPPLPPARKHGVSTPIVQEFCTTFCVIQGPVVHSADNAIHRINHYPTDSVVCC